MENNRDGDETAFNIGDIARIEIDGWAGDDRDDIDVDLGINDDVEEVEIVDD